MIKIPLDGVLESLYKLRVRESDQPRTVLELYDMEIHQKISMPNCQKLKTMVKRSIDQKLRLRKFDARHEKIETGAVVRSQKGLSGVKEERYLLPVERNKGSVRKETNAVSGTTVMSLQNRHQKPHHPLSHNFSKTQGRGVSRRRAARGRSQSEKFNRPPCKYFLKGTCTKSPCEYWHPPECQFCKSKSGCQFGAECLFLHWKVEEASNRKPKKGDDKSAVAFAKSLWMTL